MVVLDMNSSVLEAARAIETNNVGAVLVRNDGQIAGIVTDRDLAVRVVGRGLDAETTTIGDVMTTPGATHSIRASRRGERLAGVREVPSADRRETALEMVLGSIFGA
jgi:CBS domain-containing protein